MIHVKTINSRETSPEHYAVNHNGLDRIIVQLGDDRGEQVRIALTREEAVQMAKRLLNVSQKIDKLT